MKWVNWFFDLFFFSTCPVSWIALLHYSGYIVMCMYQTKKEAQAHD